MHALHSRHRSSVSYMALLVNAACGTRPASTARRALARPRVECVSSRVAMYDGHIVPSLSLRQAPLPLHMSMAVAKPPSRVKSRLVLNSIARYAGPWRRFSVGAGPSTTLPGFMRLSGSKARFTSLNAL